MKIFITALVGVVFVLVDVEEGRGELLNIDIGSHWGPPTSAFGGPSGQSGAWNNINSLGTTANLLDLAGVPTDVDLTLTADAGGNAGGVPISDAELLVKDMLYSNTGSQWTVQLAGVDNGTYDVYVYAPAHGFIPTRPFTVNGIAVANLPGTFSGSFIEGVNYAVVADVVVSAGTLTLTSSSIAGYGGLSGIQLVPEPSTFLLLLSAIGMLHVRRGRCRYGYTSGNPR